MKSAKRILAMLLVLVMMMGTLSAFAAAPGDFADFPHGTWSEAAMTAAVGNGLLQGKGVNTIAPKDYLTRAEAATIINRAFGATVTKDISQFTDVTPGQWYYVEMQKAANMETIVGTSSTTMDPLGYITRESMMTVLARALVLSDSDTSSLSKFADGASVSSWAAPYVAAMTRLGYVNGDGNGYINPQAYITREEFAQIMHNTIKTYITASGTVKDVTYNTTLIRTPGVTLENVVINGDLIIGDGVGAGDVNLTNVKVSGRILFRGGEGKVTLKKTTVGEYIVVHDVNGTVNFNNYETEMVFDDHLQNTPATFLKKPGSTVGGGVSRKSYTVNVYLMKLDGKYPDTPDDTDTVSAKSGATITYNTGKTGFTLDTAKGNLTGTNNGSLVIDAYYARNKYKVSYGDYETELYYEQPISADATLIEKMNADKNADPNTTGYEFVGFKDADGNSVDPATTTVGAKELKIEVVKTAKSFTISYELNGYGTLPQDAKTTYTIEDEDYTLPVLTDDNQIFGGWYDNAELLGDPIATIKKGITVGTLNLFAKWTPKTPGTTYHKIHFGEGQPYEVEDGKKLSTNTGLAQAMADAAKKGYTLTFTATDKNGNPIAGEITVDTIAEQEMTITAVLTIINYTITYYDEKGGSVIAEADLPAGTKTSYTIETETFDLVDLDDTTTHEFDGWYDASNDELVELIVKGTTGNKEFYATWSKIDTTDYVVITFNNKPYKVVKNEELSTNTELKNALIASQDEVDPKTGYQRYFEGYWESNGQTQSEIVTVGSVARRDMTIEAKRGPITYYINYYLSKTDENRDHYVEYNVETEDFDHYIPTHDEPDKYTFGGWYNKTTDEPVGTTVKKGTIGHMALYAKWIDKTDKKYTVIYIFRISTVSMYTKKP